MSIDKIKEYYAKERGFESWSEFLNNIHGFQIPSHMTEVAERYAQSQTQELQEQNAELVELVERCKDVIYAYNDYRPTATGNEILQAIQDRLTKHNHLNKKP